MAGWGVILSGEGLACGADREDEDRCGSAYEKNESA